MRFFVSVDCEGLACVVGVPGGTLTDSRNYTFACQQAVREANAAVRALFDAGAERVIVSDSHGGGVNLDYEQLDERAEIALGVGFGHRYPGMDESFDGVLFIGYHAMDNTPDAVLAHSYSSRAYQWIEVNGVQMGEVEIDAAIAGEMGVPVIFVSSDDKCVDEARRFLPWVEAVVTKQSFGWNAALSKHPKRVEQETYEAVARAVTRLPEMRSFRVDSPVTVRLHYKRMEDAERQARSDTRWRRIDAYTTEAVFERLSDWL